MIRTTVMLSEETHARLRRLAQRRGVPLAAVIREALTEKADTEARPTLSFVGAIDADVGFIAQDTVDQLPPITPPVSDVTPEELQELRRWGDEMLRRRRDAC